MLVMMPCILYFVVKLMNEIDRTPSLASLTQFTMNRQSHCIIQTFDQL